MHFLQELVQRKIKELGEQNASEFFGVGVPLIRQWALGSKKVSVAAVEKVFSTQEVLESLTGKEASWEGKELAILLPFYKTTNPQTLFSLCSVLDRTKMALMQNFGDAFIVHSRNKLATRFMNSKVPWAFWLDDDMIMQTGSAKWFNAHTGFNLPDSFAGHHSINRLLSHGKSIVGALYFGRVRVTDNAMFHGGVMDPALSKSLRENPQDAVIPTEWVATGGLLTHRDVYVDIAAKFPELAPQHVGEYWHFFSNSETDLTKATNSALAILNDESVSEKARLDEVRSILVLAKQAARMNSLLRQGEDVTFCKRAAAAGHQPHVDLGLRFGHVGSFVY